MDVLSDTLRSIRLEGTVFFYSLMEAPWVIKKPASATPIFHIALNGSCFVQSEAMARPIRLTGGDIVLICDGSAHWIGDSPDSKRMRSAPPCVPLEEIDRSPGPESQTVELLCGIVNFSGGTVHPLISTLPPYIHIQRAEHKRHKALDQSIALLRLEMGTAASGVGVMTDRLCEIILIQIFRTFGAGHSKGFLAALNDPPVRAVLNIIHSQYQDHWTIETLAQKVYISRSVLARRFNDLLGIPPIAYLTTWRMHKGMDLLMERQDMTIDNIAFAVGYSSAEAFERAFKRYFGRSPGMTRKRGWTRDTAQDAARRGQDSKPAL